VPLRLADLVGKRDLLPARELTACARGYRPDTRLERYFGDFDNASPIVLAMHKDAD
jgi:hypothetical protein